MRKIHIGVFFGGKSAEHEISLLSAVSVIGALDKGKYQIIPIGIDKNGSFFVYDMAKEFILNPTDAKKIALAKGGTPVTFSFSKGKTLVGLEKKTFVVNLDVALPVLHGAYGEDGAFQGLLKMANIPFVGCGVLASAVGMDKDVAKRLLRDAKIDVADFVVFNSAEKKKINFGKIKRSLGLPFFMKPANAGSSVGVYRIEDEKYFLRKVNDAFHFDTKVIFETAIVGKEVECSVMGNEVVSVSLPGAVTPKDKFYSYKAKYIEKDGAIFEIPVSLPFNVKKQIVAVVAKVYQVLGCEGMARVDGFLQKDNKFIVNEINTIPGFTSISMYPKLWQVSGLSYKKLLDKLISLALSRKKMRDKIENNYLV